MKLLITAGNTMTLVDKVRCITNIFSGRTGASIAELAAARGHHVTLLTSKPEVVSTAFGTSLQVEPFVTFDDLHQAMKRHIEGTKLDGIIHCAAVSDFDCAGVYAPSPGTDFDAVTREWHAELDKSPSMVDRGAGKVKSSEPELWLRLVRTPKLVDKIRSEWGFHGLLVKFKLEVGILDEQLLAVAEKSRLESRADLMVANTLETMSEVAFIGPLHGSYQRLNRSDLAQRIISELEQRFQNPN